MSGADLSVLVDAVESAARDCGATNHASAEAYLRLARSDLADALAAAVEAAPATGPRGPNRSDHDNRR